MRLLIEQLLNSSVPGANIMYINKESLEFDALKDYRDLYRYTVDHFKADATASQSTMVRQAHHDNEAHQDSGCCPSPLKDTFLSMKSRRLKDGKGRSPHFWRTAWEMSLSPVPTRTSCLRNWPR